jgi:hypothetical protein
MSERMKTLYYFKSSTLIYPIKEEMPCRTI